MSMLESTLMDDSKSNGRVEAAIENLDAAREEVEEARAVG